MHDIAAMTWGETVEAAKALSGLTNAEITRRFNKATGLDFSPANVQRWFSRFDEYWPSAPYLPVLCRILGNNLMIEWLAHQVAPDATVEPATIDDVRLLMPRLVRELGDVGREVEKAVKDDQFKPHEARKVRRELLDVKAVVDASLDRLEPLVGQLPVAPVAKGAA